MRTMTVVVCLVVYGLSGPSAAQAQLRTVAYATGLTSPIAFEQDPSDPANQYIAEQRGVIRLIRNGVVQATPFLDISSLVVAAASADCSGSRFLPITARADVST